MSSVALNKRTAPLQAAAIAAATVHTIVYALWFGGIIMIGALIAPAVVGVLGQTDTGLDPTELKLTLTGGVIGQALRHFTVVCYASGVLMIACDMVELAVLQGSWAKVLTGVRAVVAALLLCSAVYLGAFLTPRMDLLLTQHNMGLFDSLHKQYESIVISFQTPLLLVIPLLTALRNSRREAPNR